MTSPSRPSPKVVVGSATKAGTGPKAGQVLGAAVGAALGAAAMQILPRDVAARLLGGTLAGLLVGLLPAYVARRKGSKGGTTAVWCCGLAGLLLGLVLAVPVSLGFTWWVSRGET